jgi:hypothetical protein
LLPRHQPVAPAGEEAPALEVGGAEIGAALGGAESLKLAWLDVEAGALRHQVSDIVAGPAAQKRQLPRRGAQRDVAAVAGDEEVRDRREERRQRSGGDREESPAPPAGAP